MDALLTGTGGAAGWPQPGCWCASCMRARSAGLSRAPGRVLVDGQLEFAAGRDLHYRTPAAGRGHQVSVLSGGWLVTGPDGRRLLLAAGPGQIPDPRAGTEPADIALLDLLGCPAQLGKLRATGVVHPQTAVVALYTDHRVPTQEEMARRCLLWRAGHGQDGQLVREPAAAGQGPCQRAALARPHRTLLIGGARSGKSTEAELRLSGEPDVTYLAAGPYPDPRDVESDAEWALRVTRHTERRPAWWRTIETLDVPGALRSEPGAVLIDGLGTWLAAIMSRAGMWAQPPAASGTDPADTVRAEIDGLIEAWRQTRALVVAVTDEVGYGLVPEYPSGRVFRDQLGWLNQRIAAESELTLQVVAGRTTTIAG